MINCVPFVDPFHYQLWLSLDEHLQTDQDTLLAYTLPEGQPFASPQTASEALALSGSVALPDTVAQSLCGQVYLVVQLDSQDHVKEVDETNNVKAAPITIQCTGGEHSQCLGPLNN